MKIIKALIAANLGILMTDCLCIAAKEPLASEALMKEHKDKRINYVKGITCILLAPGIIASEAIQKTQPIEQPVESKPKNEAEPTLY